MTGEADSAAVRPDPPRSSAAVTDPLGQHRHRGHTDRGPHVSGQRGADRNREDPVVTDLVTRARNGDKQAWDALVERYAPLIWSICRRHRLGGDAEDVAQIVWLQLVDQVGKIRDPAALPGWLATVARRECLRILRRPGSLVAGHVLDTETLPDERTGMVEEELLAAERQAALLEAFQALPPRCQRLITLLIEDPPVPYAEISARLGIPVGSIGPNRSRCLDKMRRHPALAALINADSHASGARNTEAPTLAAGIRI
jgi:RNA polymerase sigma factor (sigma-70 family)